MKRHLFTVFAYVAATFITQAISHFVVNSEHYATIQHMRPEPIFQLGFLAMLIEGIILSILYAKQYSTQRTIKDAVGFSWLMGGFLVSYMAFAEAAKYTVPSVAAWIGIEMVSAFIQFTAFGVLLGLIYRDK